MDLDEFENEIESEDENVLEAKLRLLQQKLAEKKRAKQHDSPVPSSSPSQKPIQKNNNNTGSSSSDSPKRKRDTTPESNILSTPPRATSNSSLGQSPAFTSHVARRKSMDNDKDDSSIIVPGTPPPKYSSPSTPTRKASPKDVSLSPVSPARVLLGLDKGKTGWDVSLKRSPKRNRELVKRLQSIHGDRWYADDPLNNSQPGSFSKKVAETKISLKEETKKKREKEKLHVNSFRVESHSEPDRNKGKGISQQHSRNNTNPNEQSPESLQGIKIKGLNLNMRDPRDPSIIIEPFASFRLSRQNIPFEKLYHQLDSLPKCALYTLSKLYAKVYPPYFDPPEEPNWVLFAVIANKSKVMYANKKAMSITTMFRDKKEDEQSLGKDQPEQAADNLSKFMMITLTDLGIYEISLAISGKAFDQYWKLSEGTVVAILNPNIYVTRNKKSNDWHDNLPDNSESKPEPESFSISLNDHENCILELGVSNDYGRCKAITTKGTQCKYWINTTRSTFCDFHNERRVSKARGQRMEMNSVSMGSGRPRTAYAVLSNPNHTTKTLSRPLGSSNPYFRKDPGPDYQRKQGLLPDSNMSHHNGSKVYVSSNSLSSLSRSTNPHLAKQARAQAIGQVFSRSVSKSEFDSSYRSSMPYHLAVGVRAQESLQRQAEMTAKTKEIRAKLKRKRDAGGEVFRAYESKVLGSDPALDPDASNSSNPSKPRLFKPEHIRKLGFDPTANVIGGMGLYDSSILPSRSSSSSSPSSSSSRAGRSTDRDFFDKEHGKHPQEIIRKRNSGDEKSLSHGLKLPNKNNLSPSLKSNNKSLDISSRKSFQSPQNLSNTRKVSSPSINTQKSFQSSPSSSPSSSSILEGFTKTAKNVSLSLNKRVIKHHHQSSISIDTSSTTTNNKSGGSNNNTKIDPKRPQLHQTEQMNQSDEDEIELEIV